MSWLAFGTKQETHQISVFPFRGTALSRSYALWTRMPLGALGEAQLCLVLCTLWKPRNQPV